jgi:hypothetical protein
MCPCGTQEVAGLKERAVNELRVRALDGLVYHLAQLLRHEGIPIGALLGRLGRQHQEDEDVDEDEDEDEDERKINSGFADKIALLTPRRSSRRIARYRWVVGSRWCMVAVSGWRADWRRR